MAKEQQENNVVEFQRVDAGVYAVPKGDSVTDDQGCTGDLYEITYATYEGFKSCGVVVDLSDDYGEPAYRAVRYEPWLGANEYDVDSAVYDTLEEAARATYPDAA